jgi:hypothetical protein
MTETGSEQRPQALNLAALVRADALIGSGREGNNRAVSES